MENEKMNAFLHFPNESLEKCSGTIIKGQNLESLQILSIAIFGKFIIDAENRMTLMKKDLVLYGLVQIYVHCN